MIIDESLAEKIQIENREFLKLCNLHSEYEKQINYYNKKHLLNTQDELEKKKIQKLKLSLKDQIDQIVSDFKSHEVQEVRSVT